MNEARSDVVVVIPMPNDPDWALFDEIPTDVQIIVPDDSDGNLAPAPRPNVRYFDYAAQRDYMGENYDAIPHKSAACRNFGHVVAWNEGFDTIIALDYDCHTKPGWLDAHLKALRGGDFPGHAPVQPNGWVNPINAPGFYARGYPYELRNPIDAEVEQVTISGTAKLHIGVWEKIVDLNGIDRLGHEAPYDPGVFADEPVAALGPIPVCGMNTSFRRELIPAYFFLPDLWVDDGSPGGWQLSRHDDIWGGYVIKRLMDIKGDLMTFGGPIVEHTRLTPAEKTTKIEHYMHMLAWQFFGLVDDAVADVANDSYHAMFSDFVERYLAAVNRSGAPRHFVDVYRRLGESMQRWARCFD